MSILTDSEKKLISDVETYYYKDTEFHLLQCIYPTVKGIYPWQSEWPEDIKDRQPVLGSVNIQ